MKAFAYHAYGGPEVLELEDVAVPSAKDDEVLVRVRAASVNPRDWHFMRGLPYFLRLQFGLRRPRDSRLGSDIAGEVVAVGRNVTRLRPGDEVYADVPIGAFAEYVCVSESLVALKPANLTFEQAAAVPLAGVTALQGLRDVGRVRPGAKVLIIGAAVQIAKGLGATVTGVCSTSKVELVLSLGADDVIDYTHEDFVDRRGAYDVIFQLAGTRSPADCRRALTREGTLILSSGESEGRWIGPVDRMIEAFVRSPFVPQRLVSFEAKRSRTDLERLKDLIEAGEVRPVIDCTYPLSQLPAAIRYLEEGHARGKVLITV